MHKLCAQIKKSKHRSRSATQRGRGGDSGLTSPWGRSQGCSHTYTRTHFKTIKQTFFFSVQSLLDLQKAQHLFKSRRCMNFEKRKTSTKITFKTFQPHNAAGQKEVRERGGLATTNVYIFYELTKNC